MTRRRFLTEQYDLAGMTDEDRGGLGRPAPGEVIDALLDCRLETDPESQEELVVFDRRSPTPVRIAPSLLDDFIELEEAEPNQILAFARKWGALQLCSRGLPRLHPPNATCSPPDGEFGCLPRGYPKDSLFEGCDSVTMWQRWARHFRGILDVAADLIDDKKPSDEHLERMHRGRDAESESIVRHDGRFYVLPKGHSVATPLWFDIASEVNGLIWLAGCQPWMECDYTGRRSVVLSGHGSLFGALTIQLLMATSAQRGFAFCSECQGRYEIKDRKVRGRTVKGRKPRSGENHYCPSCQKKGVPAKKATARYRASRAAR